MDNNIEGVESSREQLGAPSPMPAAAAAESDADAAADALAGLPGMQRRSEPQRVALFGGDTLALHSQLGLQSDWDLRAAMEKRRRMERERAAWQATRRAAWGGTAPWAPIGGRTSASWTPATR